MGVQQVMPQASPQTAEQTDPLAELRDIHFPDAIQDWPPAPGWWFMGILIFVLVIHLTIRVYRYWQSKQYRREGVRALNSLKSEFESSLDSVSLDTNSPNTTLPNTALPNSRQYLDQYSQLLKRVAFSCFPRSEVASLSGESWVAFLDLSGNTKEFSMGCGQVLIEGHYAQSSEFDYLALHELGILWIKNHKRVVL